MRTLFAITLMTAILMAAPLTRATDIPRDLAFDIPAQPLTDALLSYSEQARVQLILAADTSMLPPCQPLQGNMSAEDALARLLAESGLEYYFSSPNTVTVRRVPPYGFRTDASDKFKSPPQPAN